MAGRGAAWDTSPDAATHGGRGTDRPDENGLDTADAAWEDEARCDVAGHDGASETLTRLSR